MSDDKRTMTPEQWRDTKDTGPANSLADPDAALRRGKQMNDSNNAATAATSLETCPKCGDDIYYYPACNEDGWRCMDDADCGYKPGEPPGFDPQRDRELISLKVHGLLLDLHQHGFIHCSNSGHGEATVHAAAERCKETGRFDQYSIIEFIFAGRESHAEYWSKVSEGVLAGADPRDRCSNGNIANMWTAGSHYCLQRGCGCQSEIEDDS